MVAKEAAITGELAYRINTEFGERILRRYGRVQAYETFMSFFGKHKDGNRRFYRFDYDRKPLELNVFGKCEEEFDKTIIERPIRALIAYHPLSVYREHTGTVKIDSYFEMWFNRNALGMSTETFVPLCFSPFRKFDTHIHSHMQKFNRSAPPEPVHAKKTIEKLNLEGIAQTRRGPFGIHYVDEGYRASMALDPYIGPRIIEDSCYLILNELLEELFEGFRKAVK